MPYKAWFSHNPNLSHLCKIGCRAFVLIQNRHNPKIFNHLTKCVLIGYSLDSNAYRCYHRPSNKVFVSYHVSFIESFNDHTMSLHPRQSLLNPPAPFRTHVPGLPSPASQCTSVCDAKDDTNNLDPNFPTPMPLSMPPPRHSALHVHLFHLRSVVLSTGSLMSQLPNMLP
jgi:hypothetical protein